MSNIYHGFQMLEYAAWAAGVLMVVAVVAYLIWRKS